MGDGLAYLGPCDELPDMEHPSQLSLIRVAKDMEPVLSTQSQLI